MMTDEEMRKMHKAVTDFCMTELKMNEPDLAAKFAAEAEALTLLGRLQARGIWLCVDDPHGERIVVGPGNAIRYLVLGPSRRFFAGLQVRKRTRGGRQ